MDARQGPMHGNPVGIDDDVVQLMSRLEGVTDPGHPELQTLTAAALTGQGDVVFIWGATGGYLIGFAIAGESEHD